jgi:predicted ATPase/DNA-binding SARP family transcriptional activator
VTTAVAVGHSRPMSSSAPADRPVLALQVDVLGPLALRVDGRPVEVPGTRRRALLVLLALAARRTVAVERLVEELWPDDVPDNAQQALYNHVSRLRRHLGPHADRLVRRDGGYSLALSPDELDAQVARRLVHASERPGTTPESVARQARQALSLWRGPALVEFAHLPAVEVEAVALEELRLRVQEVLLEAELDRGEDVVAQAAAAVAASPLRERTVLALVRALAARGRTAEAMEAAHDYRRRLADETGLDPGPAVADLEQQVASGALAAAPPSGPGPALVPRHVPRPDGPLVGRREDRAEVLRLLGDHAVVVVTGPGGVGKTRLALDVASDPAATPRDGSGAVPVDLAAVDTPERVCQAVASTLGLPTRGPVDADEVASALAGGDLLLVLDNCEHVVAACRALVMTLRRRAPGVRVLATSRVSLHVPGEYVVRLQPLPVPRDPRDLEALRRQPVVRAFLEHARRRVPDYDVGPDDVDDLLDVVRRLDGLPLGLELAARQVAVMPLRDVRRRLDRALDLATGRHGPDADRQRTLRATIGASYRLLDEESRRLLDATAVFPGGVDLETVEHLAAATAVRRDPLDLLHGLVDASLVIADAASGRYRLLFTVRAFLLDGLRAGGGLAEAEDRFLRIAVDTARDIGVQLLGSGDAEADRRLRTELDNLRAARDVARAHGRDDVLVDITLAFNEVAAWRDLRELWSWATELVGEEPRLREHPRWPMVLGWGADAARLRGDLDGALALADRAIAEAGPDPEPGQVRRAWNARAAVAHFRADFDGARDAWLRAAAGRPVAEGGLVASAALAAAYGGDPQEARRLLDRAHAAQGPGGARSVTAFVSYVEGELLGARDPAAAVPHYREAIAAARATGADFVWGVASVALASARARTGDTAGAAEEFARLLQYWRWTGQQTQLWTTARNAAGLLAATGSTDVAALLLLSADATPAAAAVGQEIARHSGRVYVPVESLADDTRLAVLREEVAALGPEGVLDRAVTELQAVAEAQGTT